MSNRQRQHLESRHPYVGRKISDIREASAMPQDMGRSHAFRAPS